MNEPLKVPAADDQRLPTSHGEKLNWSNGRATYLRFRAACLSIRFWRACREFSDRRFSAALTRGKALNNRLQLRGALREVCR
jgi:hypothetical protein